MEKSLMTAGTKPKRRWKMGEETSAPMVLMPTPAVVVGSTRTAILRYLLLLQTLLRSGGESATEFETEYTIITTEHLGVEPETNLEAIDELGERYHHGDQQRSQSHRCGKRSWTRREKDPCSPEWVQCLFQGRKPKRNRANTCGGGCFVI